MTNDEEPKNSDLMDALMKAIDEQDGPTLLDIAKTQDMKAALHYLHTNRHFEFMQEEKGELLLQMIEMPQSFANPLALFQAATEKFNYGEFYEEHAEGLDKKIWAMYAASPIPDIAHIGGVLMSEFLRSRLLQNLNYQPDITKDVRQEIKAAGLTAETKRTALRDSMIAIQNAMVDHVTQDGPVLPLHRAAAWLPVLEDDLKPHVSDLWKRKLTAFSISSVYSIKNGDVLKIQPVFS